jgi:thiamine monophosphate synthase
MKLIVISSPINIESESETILLLFKADLKYFHLRKPNLSLREFEYFLDRIPKQYLNRVIIHQHHELIEKYPLKGVHYTQHLINFKYLDSQDKIHRSKSCHSIFDGVAILGTIWQENTVDRRLQKFQEIQTKM